MSGDVIAVNGLLLKLSEPVFFEANETYAIALRLRGGSIDVIDCFESDNANEVILSRPPIEPLYTGTDEERTVFIFDNNSRLSAKSYIISEVDRTNINEVKIKAVNYTDKYYESDKEKYEG